MFKYLIARVRFQFVCIFDCQQPASSQHPHHSHNPLTGKNNNQPAVLLFRSHLLTSHLHLLRHPPFLTRWLGPISIPTILPNPVCSTGSKPRFWPEADLNEAAQRSAADIAVYYSDDHWEQKVPIMYTDPRHVAKWGTNLKLWRKLKTNSSICLRFKISEQQNLGWKTSKSCLWYIQWCEILKLGVQEDQIEFHSLCGVNH